MSEQIASYKSAIARLKEKMVQLTRNFWPWAKVLSINGSLNPGNYINASFILDPLHQNLPGFHCSSGTSEFTVTDFWQMAVLQRCPVISMLTRLLEDDHVNFCKGVPISSVWPFPSDKEGFTSFARWTYTSKTP
ncbi:unnamed protein product [Calypogeia fissa]